VDLAMNAIELQIADALPDIFEDAKYPKVNGSEPVSDNIIPNGQRNDTLARMAGSMRHKGFPLEAIELALGVVNQQRCQPPLNDTEVRSIAQSIGRYAPTVVSRPPLIGLTFDQLQAHTFPERRPLLMRGDSVVFREGHLGEIFAARGIGKTWLLRTLALLMATGSEALGFRAPSAVRVLDVDGEMDSHELKERDGIIAERLGISSAPNLTTIAADWQEGFLPRFDTDEGQEALEPFLESADVVILDNRSCLFDPEGEKDATAWQSAQDKLLSLRRRGKAVLVGHHSNRQGAARGHSKPEDVMNLLIGLTRPEDYRQDQGARFNVTFEKSRGAYGAAVAPFLAHLTLDGWKTQAIDSQHEQASVADKLLAYVKAASAAGERPKSATSAIVGAKVNRNAGFEVWADLLNRGAIQKHHEGGFYAR
jgi:putative DNA primase/helicase